MKKAFLKALKGFGKMSPIILGTMLLVSLLSVLIPKSFYTTVFNKNAFLDSLVGALIGSLSAGNPVTSYIFGGEMLNNGVGLLAVTAFIVSWVTVGTIQIPAEASTLGKKFSLLRNLSAFVLAILTAIITVLILGVVG